MLNCGVCTSPRLWDNPTSAHRDFPGSASLLTLGIVRLFNFCWFGGCEIISYCSFNLSFYNIFIGYLGFIFYKLLIHIVCPIFYCFFLSFLGWSCMLVHAHTYTVIQWPLLKVNKKVKHTCFSFHIWPWYGIIAYPSPLEKSLLLWQGNITV